MPSHTRTLPNLAQMLEALKGTQQQEQQQQQNGGSDFMAEV
jgi:hypothetical protein